MVDFILAERWSRVASPKEAALFYASMSWPVIPCRISPTGGKPPQPGVDVKWNEKLTIDPAQIEEWWTKWPDSLIGFVPGRAGLIALDLDIKGGKNGEEALPVILAQFGAVYPVLGSGALNAPRSRTRSGGSHYFFKKPPGESFGSSRGAFKDQGIDILCDANYLILPSPGSGYAWQQGGAPWDIEFPMVPGEVIRAIRNETGKPEKKRSRRSTVPVDMSKVQEALSFIPNEDLEYDAYIEIGMALRNVNARDLWMEWCAGSRKNDPKTNSFKWKSFSEDGDVTIATLFHRAKENGWRDRESEIFAGAITKGKQILPIVNNVVLAVRQSPELYSAIAFDEMTQSITILKELPCVPGSKPVICGGFPRKLMDVDVIQLQEWFQRSGVPTVSADTVRTAIYRYARENSFHPVQDYLNSLRWDGISRLDSWLHDYLGTANAPYHAQVGRMFMVAMVARIYQPGCKADYMMVMEGHQGKLKSSVCEALAGRWFSDNLPDVDDHKEAAQHLRGVWLVEVAELDAMRKADVESLKKFITRRNERYRPPYAHEEVIEPRQCLFIGTTNRHVYLKDETGSRRFWPIDAGDISLNKLIKDRDQLFAEAVMLYNAGVKWWPDMEFEQSDIKDEQEKRFEEDAWAVDVREFVEQFDYVRIKDVAEHALQLPTTHRSSASENRIRGILLRLGWRRRQIKGTHGWEYRSPRCDDAAKYSDAKSSARKYAKTQLEY